MENKISLPYGNSDRPSPKEFFSEEDYAFIVNLASYWDRDVEGATYEPFTSNEYLARLCARLAGQLLESGPEVFEHTLELIEDRYRLYGNPTFARLVVLGLEYGVAWGDGACANYLGAMYYMGDVVEQDYNRAKELYELAESKGILQAMVNLGYIYEYGRTGEPDHLKAYMQYSKVAAIGNHFEALYKLGDMYSRAKVVKKDPRFAYRLYETSLEVACGDVQKAQPAIRIAKLISNPDNRELGIPFDPMYALELYQLAERGLREDIAGGATYYARRLQEAIEGQDRVRMILDGGTDFRD